MLFSQVVILLNEYCEKDVEEWLKRCSETHVFAVEHRPVVADNSKVFLIMLLKYVDVLVAYSHVRHDNS